jgi:hypothetical protein
MNRWVARINIVFAVLFLLSALLQVNDPDPLGWIVLYTAAGIACLAARRDRGARVLPALVGAAALAWSMTLAPAALDDLRPLALIKPMDEKTPAIELGREFLGLLIVASWMLVLTLASRRRGRAQG